MDEARHNRKSKWQFNLTEPTKTKSNANKSPFRLHSHMELQSGALSCTHIYIHISIYIYLSCLAYVLVRTYRIDAFILARADEGDILVAPLVHHVGADCRRRKEKVARIICRSKFSKLSRVSLTLALKSLLPEAPVKKLKRVNLCPQSYYITGITSISINT